MKKKRTAAEKHEGIQNALERRGKLNYNYRPVQAGWTMPDGSYNYRGTVGQRMGRVFLRTLVKLFAPLITFCVCGARVVGRKNLKGLKGGAVSICNHIHYLDTFFIRRAVGAFRSYHTMGPWNNRKDFVGFIMRRGAMLPLTANLAGMRNLNAELERLVTKKKQIINFYPEQAFWKNYQKPRPMMDGAFHYAVKFNVPVVPIFCTFKKKKGKPKKLRINVLPLLYPNEALPRAERIADLKARAQAAWKQCYEKAYGIPLEYLTRE